MDKLRKIGTTLRNHRKKTVFFSAVGAYGVKWFNKKLEDEAFLRNLAQEALSYGSATISGVQTPSYNVTVILNPVSSGGKGRKLYEKYCAPLLHLAGMKVSVIRTESEGQAKDIMEIMSDADAVLVAGGDGTLMEAVTGLLRRKDRDTASKIPIGVLPVGKTNTLAHKLFSSDDNVKLMGLAAMSVVRQLKKPLSVIELENRSEDENFRGKKMYCVNNVELGGWKDARQRMDRYWLFGFGLKNYVTYIGSFLTGHKEVLWDCDVSLQFMGEEQNIEENHTENIIEVPQAKSNSWFSWLKSNDKEISDKNLTNSVNKKWIDYGRFNGTQITIENTKDTLASFLYPKNVTFLDFVSHGWKQVMKDPISIERTRLESDQFLIDPNLNEEKTKQISIDGDDIDFNGPLLVTHQKDKIVVFCDKSEAMTDKPSVVAPSKRWSSLGSSNFGRSLKV